MPDYRLTLANTGFIFNTLFTLINTFLIEQEIAEKFDCRTLKCIVLLLIFMFLG